MAQRVKLGTEIGTGRSIHNSLILEKRTRGPERLQILFLPVTEYFGVAARAQLPEAHTGAIPCGEKGTTPRKLGAQENPSRKMQYPRGSKSEQRQREEKGNANGIWLEVLSEDADTRKEVWGAVGSIVEKLACIEGSLDSDS